MSMSTAEVEEFLKGTCTPVGYKYTLVLVSVTKRVFCKVRCRKSTG
jgi:hypothetical protein